MDATQGSQQHPICFIRPLLPWYPNQIQIHQKENYKPTSLKNIGAKKIHNIICLSQIQEYIRKTPHGQVCGSKQAISDLRFTPRDAINTL